MKVRTFAAFALVAVCAAQGPRKADISTVAATGVVSENRYTNSFFKLTIYAPNATLELNPLVNTAEQRARLVQILSKQAKWEDTYTFAMMADSLTRHPNLQSPAHYVRSVRHQLERQGLPTVREEFPITIAGVHFTGAVLEEQVVSGQKHYRGVYTTFRDGYILSFDAEAASENKLNDLVRQLVKIETK
jgi:hypothetical protein